jgi:hypothetical protein
VQTQSLINSWEQLGRQWTSLPSQINGFLSPQWQQPDLAAVAVALQAASCRKPPELVIEEVLEERLPEPSLIEDSPAQETVPDPTPEMVEEDVVYFAVPKVVDYRSATGQFFSQLPWTLGQSGLSEPRVPEQREIEDTIATQWSTGEFFQSLPWSAKREAPVSLASKIGGFNVMQLATESAIAAAKRHKSSNRSPFSSPKKNTVGEFFSSLPWSQPVKGHS